MLSICILQTQSPLKRLPDSITGHSDIWFWGEGKMFTPSCSWKKCSCQPVLKLGASCHCLTCWCVLVSPHTRAKRQLRVAAGWCAQDMCPCPWPPPARALEGADRQPQKQGRLFLALWVLQQNLQKQKWHVHGDLGASAAGVWCHFNRILVQISS